MDKEMNKEEREHYIDALLNDLENTPIEPVNDGQISYIDSLLLRAEITEEEKEHIEKAMFGYSYVEAAEIIEYLKLNQLDELKRAEKRWEL